MATTEIAAALEQNIRTLTQTKRVRIGEFFQDYDKLRSGYVSVPQFFRCLHQTLALKFSDEEQRVLREKYGLPLEGKINYKQFCNVIDINFDPTFICAPPDAQTNLPLEYLGTIRTKRPLTVDSESRVVAILRRMQKFYNLRGINLRTQYTDFDKHHMGVVSESQFYRNFPGPPDIDEEDIKTLVEKYNVPNSPGLINYLNLHNDVVAVNKYIEKEKDPRISHNERQTDFVALYPSNEPTYEEIMDKLRVASYKNGIRAIEFFKDHDKLRSGIITENQFSCGVALAFGKEVKLSRPEIQKLVEYYRITDGRVQYRDFCTTMENAFNIPDLEKKPTETVHRPGRGTLSRGLMVLSDLEEQRIMEILSTIGEKVKKERIMMYQYFKDFDRSTAYTRVVTAQQFARALHFLDLNVNNEDFKLLLKKFQDPTSGDVNYPAFVQCVDYGFVGQVIEPEKPDYVERDQVLQIQEPKSVEPAPVLFEELIARIRHVVLANRLRVIECFQDYDPLRSGSITKTQFRRGLAAMGLSKLGHHDLNNSQYRLLVERYQDPYKPDKILWTTFMSDVESVFTQERLEQAPLLEVPRQEIFRVPKPGTVDWSNASKDHMDLYSNAMERIRQRVKHRRILIKPVFQDFDRHNNGHISTYQFRQCFKSLEIPIEEPEMQAFEALYCNDFGVDYSRFLQDLEPAPPVPFMYIARMENLRNVNQKKMLPEIDACTDLENVYNKIKNKVCRERIRVYEFMKDYDKLHSGRMPKTTFRRAISMARLDLKESELSIIEDRYQSGYDADYIEYDRFCKDIESIFTKEHLDKAPLEEVEQFKPANKWSASPLTELENEQVMKCLLRLAEKVHKHRMQLFPLFEDYDKVHIGAVSQSQFRRVLTELDLGDLVSDSDIQLLWKKYMIQVGGRTDVNYVDFCHKVFEMSGFEYAMP